MQLVKYCIQIGCWYILRCFSNLEVFIAVSVCHFLACMLANSLSNAGKYRYHHRRRRHHGVYYLLD